MWSLVPGKVQITILVAIAIMLSEAVHGLWQFFNDESLSLIRITSLVAALIATPLVVLVNFAWRWIWKLVPKMNDWFFPDLNGTWEGSLVSTWKNSQDESLVPILSRLKVKQGMFRVVIEMQTGESRSRSTRVLLEADREFRTYRFWYSFDNIPYARVAHRSARHEGVAWLEIDTTFQRNELAGQYYTSRKTSGDMAFTRTSLT